ncbi:ATP-grasp domain-containing protein [Sphaerisporangium rhizosphaerae]|uniref:RimK family alpha-L-glutamate ligase n=1 Tax=Sphaerisporangium rhizosphaerae TaxID=2269375 RepID=A0ABW2NWV7_9ACTN
MRFAYVTYDGPDDDREVLLAAWRRAGAEGAAVRWDDPAADWDSFDAVVVRSPWDYILRRDQFVEWAHKVESGTRLFNPASVIERNTDKTYLRDLGVPTVPTHWIHPGEQVALPHQAEYVVKPAISAGARDTLRTADRATAEAHARDLVAAGRVAMVQPYLDMVETEGETSMIYIGGRFSHARRRNAMLADVVPADHRAVPARDPGPDQFALAEQVLAEVGEDLLYARVDLVRLPGGAPALIELELTEPYLFLSTTPGAADRLTTALLTRL